MAIKITKELLIEKGFKQVDKFNAYRYTIKSNIMDNVRTIEASLMPHNKWIGLYEVNGYSGSEIMRTTEEIERLYQAVTGNKL